MPGFQELIFLAIIIIVLSWTGLWPTVIRALRELRGEHVPDPPGPSRSDADMCYRLMGLSPSASWEEIEKAYRRKAKVHHPDHGGDEDAMRALNEAYQTLKKIRNIR
ncbi:MAG: J domain-containing protein [Candidatus Hydrogenedens sp.]|nr:J domain-containing protein [Candidatus Hydrogenedentota bacterium]NLF59041.1 J domain-containing protein [Candidatus Hydrogenedens sp.]